MQYLSELLSQSGLEEVTDKVTLPATKLDWIGIAFNHDGIHMPYPYAKPMDR
jgi:hypothetical protein